jgi:hypothetical protein
MAKKSPQELVKEMICLFSDSEKVDQLENTFVKTFIDQTVKPSNSWSFSNRLLMQMQGTNDARGFRQWQKIGRNPFDWAKQVTILAPKITKIKDVKNDEEKTIITGFTTLGLYAIENTYGKKIEDPNETLELPNMHQVAEAWGIKVRYERVAGAWGYFSPTAKEIVLGTEDQSVYFHELAHAAHLKIDGKLQSGQDPEQEAIAQLSAAVLSRMYGVKVDNDTFKYIANYTKSNKPDAVARMCMRVAEKTSQVIELILTTKKEIEVQAV